MACSIAVGSWPRPPFTPFTRLVRVCVCAEGNLQRSLHTLTRLFIAHSTARYRKQLISQWRGSNSGGVKVMLYCISIALLKFRANIEEEEGGGDLKVRCVKLSLIYDSYISESLTYSP